MPTCVPTVKRPFSKATALLQAAPMVPSLGACLSVPLEPPAPLDPLPPVSPLLAPWEHRPLILAEQCLASGGRS